MAKKKAKKVSELRKSYLKETHRIKQFIRRAEKRGYEFAYELPKEPKRVTKQSIEKLRKITPTELYKKASFVDTETGEIISGTEGRKLERQKSAKKGHETRKANLKSQESFWTGSQPITQTVTPIQPAQPQFLVADGEDIFDNIYENFIQRLKRDPIQESYTFNGKRYKRRKGLISREQEAKSELFNLLEAAIIKYGKKKLGWLLQDYQDDMNSFLDIMEYASDDTQIDYGFLGVAKIINQIVNSSDPESFAKSEELLKQEAELYEKW